MQLTRSVYTQKTLTNINIKKPIMTTKYQFMLNHDIIFPAILTPNHNATSSLELTELVKSNKQYLDSLLHKTGAVLFRGFGLTTAAEFNETVECFGYEDFAYGAGGAGSKKKICERVYTANESPPEQMIGFHHELSHVNEFLTKLFFFCEVAPGSGGETCIVENHVIYDKMKQMLENIVGKITFDQL